MGCDFDLVIQVLRGGKWFNIVHLGTSTCCGGFPLTTATRLVAERDHILGNYGKEFPTCTKTELDVRSLLIPDTIKQKFLLPYYVNETDAAGSEDDEDEGEEEEEEEEEENAAKEKKKRKKDEDEDEEEEGDEGKKKRKKDEDEDEEGEGEEEEGEEEEEVDDYYIEKHNAKLYYSKDQFIALQKHIDPLLSDQHNAHLYNKMMKPMAKWCKMALTSMPLQDEIWMSHEPKEIKKTTDALAAGQAELRVAFEKMKTEHKRKTGGDLVLPVATDVRVAWYDCEEQCKDLRNGKKSGSADPGMEAAMMKALMEARNGLFRSF